MRCDECKLYSKIDNYGECRFNPPIINEDGESIFPDVAPDWWCGKHELEEDE